MSGYSGTGKKRVAQILLLTMAVIMGLMAMILPVQAADVDGALYIADIVATNSGEAATNVGAALEINDQAMINGKYITEDLLNTAIQTAGGADVPYMPGVGSNPWIYWLSSIGASESKPYSFYCGGPAMQEGFAYFPDDGGMTADDDASLELGDTFQIEQKGYVDTSAGSNKNLVEKEDAFLLSISAEEEITASIYNPDWVSPTGASGTGWNNPSNAYDDNTGTYTNVSAGTTNWITPSGASGWTNAGNAIDDDTGTYSERSVTYLSWSPFMTFTIDSTECNYVQWWVSRESGNISKIDLDIYYESAWHDIYENSFTPDNWETKSLGGTYEITQARVRFWNSNTPGYTYWVRLHEFDCGASGDGWSDYLTLIHSALDCNGARFYADYDAAGVNTIDLDAYYSDDWHDVYQGAFSDEAWVEKELDDIYSVTQFRVRFHSDQELDTAYLYEFDFKETIETSATVTGVSSGSKVIVSANGTSLTLSVYDEDDVLIDSDTTDQGGASVPDNSNNWSFIINGSMPYMEYQKIWVGGTLVQHIVYERDTTFQDQTAYNNDVTPTFITATTDPDVSVAFLNFRPIDEAEYTGGTGDGNGGVITTVPEEPEEFYTGSGTGFDHLPGAELINTVLDSADFPRDLFWIWLVYGMASVAVLLCYQFIRSSLLFPALMGFVIILGAALTCHGDPVELWTILPYGLMSAGFIVSERVFGW
jgi:hypothetical protein